ncbi:MAG: aspartate/glutamate racemase family protein [Lachnospiraceae bacterium]
MGVKILNLLPVTADVLTSERFDYMCRYLEPDTLVETYQITQGPPTIECEYDEALAAPYVLELCQKAKAEGFQAIFINCFGDPGVKAARELVDLPVFGGFEPATHFALGLADKIGIVTVVPNVVPLIEGNIAKARLEGRVTGVRNVNIPVES